MNRLSFLMGRFVGSQDLKFPGKQPVNFEFLCFGSKHEDERWLSLQFVAKIPGYGIESRHDFVTWDNDKERYRWVMLSNMSVDPLILDGEFNGDTLELTSQPWQSAWGNVILQARLRPLEHGSWTFDFSTLDDTADPLASMMAIPDIAAAFD
ncbi:MAG: hypothetical protein KF784_01810 [Fimbriimonadaceae bacterium]|nr:hypothetical protein [Fimbriimonadaceae bacterium]